MQYTHGAPKKKSVDENLTQGLLKLVHSVETQKRKYVLGLKIFQQLSVEHSMVLFKTYSCTYSWKAKIPLLLYGVRASRCCYFKVAL